LGIIPHKANIRRTQLRRQLQFDKIGIWSEIKLEIIREYAKAYSTILSAQTKTPLSHVYIDAFAGAGQHISRAKQELVPGSPLNALAVEPRFQEFYLIDIAPEKIDKLRDLSGPRKDVHLFQGDCNEILLRDVFPHVQYAQYRRGLCVLDPYGLHLDWNVISTAGQMKTLDVFLNFPVQDMNRNVFWRNPDRVDEVQIQRMNRFWGDESWRNIVYQTTGNLFGMPEKEPNEIVAEAFRNRLSDAAAFKYVPQPLPMRNSTGAILYYLFFASQNKTAEKIARAIFSKYDGRRSQ
jgi:three-Cys-motif partner protein